MDRYPLSAPQFWRENSNFRRLQARAVPAPSIDLNSLPLVYFGLEIILDLERSTEWSPLLNSHHVLLMRINLSSSPRSDSYKEMVVCKQTTANRCQWQWSWFSQSWVTKKGVLGRPHGLFQAKARWSPKVQNSETLHHMGATRPFHTVPGRPYAGQGWSKHLLDTLYPIGQPFCRSALTRSVERSLQKHRDFQY